MPSASRHSNVASSETAREINRDLLLQAIHRNQPVSRADLARISGLQPSTVSVIIGQLIDEGWVVAGAQGRLPRGRRPTFVMLNERHVVLAIDLRPTLANLALVDINGKMLEREAIAMPAQEGAPEGTSLAVQRIVEVARALRKRASSLLFDGVGVSVSGRVDQKTHQLLFSPNAPWMRVDLYGELVRVFGEPVEMDNAANAGLYGERWFGKLGEAQNVISVSISDGIGTGLLVDGRVLRGRNGMAGEFGHMPLMEGGPRCGCGNFGCWEVFASNRAGLRYYKEIVPDSNLTSFEQLLDLALKEDLDALRSIDRMMHSLAHGLTILSAGLAPEAVLIVGDCTALWQRIKPLLESQLIAKSFRPQTPELLATLDGEVARLRGAAALIFHKQLFRQSDFRPLSTLQDQRGRAPRL
ncbi:ROK family protein [Telmatobacter bradus]|uniref:ROK family protein n=1 Tax=Telmatobacter bradus TaxID=474953 RepID=UPI003B431483